MLVVCGDAPCLAQDMEQLHDATAHYAVVNRAGIRMLRPILYWVTYHPDAFAHERWDMQRAAAGGNGGYTVVSHHRNANLEHLGLPCAQFPGPSTTGSSVLLAVLFGLARGYDRIVVAGAPLDDDGYRSFHDGWRASRKRLAGRVSSLSGWTKTFLEGLNHGA